MKHATAEEWTEKVREEAMGWMKHIAKLEQHAEAAVERGFDKDLANYLAQSGGMQAHVREMNARAFNWPAMEYDSYEEFVLREGQAFTPPPKNKPRPKGLRKGRDTYCFMNALHAVMDHEHEGWQYVEGYATGFMPTHHAWAIDGDGNVVETTWKNAGTSYVGVVFPREVYGEVIRATGTYGVFEPEMLDQPYSHEAYRATMAERRNKKRTRGAA